MYLQEVGKYQVLDGDGDDDYVAGNLGLNLKFKASKEEPFKLFTKDFDGNGTHDVYLGYYDQDGTLYPVRGRQCSSEQMPFIKEKFEDYEAFAVASIEDILDDLFVAGNYHNREVETTRSDAGTGLVLMNDGNGNFTPLSTSKSGIYASLDARDALLVKAGPNQRKILIVANNNGPAQVFGLN